MRSSKKKSKVRRGKRNDVNGSRNTGGGTVTPGANEIFEPSLLADKAAEDIDDASEPDGLVDGIAEVELGDELLLLKLSPRPRGDDDDDESVCVRLRALSVVAMTASEPGALARLH